MPRRPASKGVDNDPPPVTMPWYPSIEAVCMCGIVGLFLKDKKGGLWLAIMLEERRCDLKRLAVGLMAPRFSFGGAEELFEALGVRPGSVTPFAVVNDVECRVIPVRPW